MTVKELQDLLQRYILVGHGSDSVVVTLNQPSVGARACTKVTEIFPGFDFEAGQMRIETQDKILSFTKDRDIIMPPWENQAKTGKDGKVIKSRLCQKCDSKVRKGDNYCSCCGQRLQ